jgi:hypothetical protein
MEIKALREELSRQRILSGQENSHGVVVNDNGGALYMQQQQEIKKLEAILLSAQNESDHYTKLLKDAYMRFKHMSIKTKSALDFTPLKYPNIFFLHFFLCVSVPCVC